jgi:hypothetical protein
VIGVVVSCVAAVEDDECEGDESGELITIVVVGCAVSD